MHGKRFIKDEFEIDSKILWLPDVFGYSAALPQILKKCGIDTFVTSKISWNETNRIPHDTFIWKGIDKTEMFTQFIIGSYVGKITPEFMQEFYNKYADKSYSDEILMTYGYGDGGGGPTREMLEQQRRMSYGINGVPKTEISHASSALESIEKKFRQNCELMHSTPPGQASCILNCTVEHTQQ